MISAGVLVIKARPLEYDQILQRKMAHPAIEEELLSRNNKLSTSGTATTAITDRGLFQMTMNLHLSISK